MVKFGFCDYEELISLNYLYEIFEIEFYKYVLMEVEVYSY